MAGGDIALRPGAASVGYARCSTDQQDLTAQRDALSGLGVEADRIYVDHGLTGTNRERPGYVRRSRPAEPGTRWWSPSSTPGQVLARRARDRRRTHRAEDQPLPR